MTSKKQQRIPVVSPGVLGGAADGMRIQFDFHNEAILYNELKIDFLFIGDSITQLWDTQAYFAREGRIIVNRGISGDITPHILKRFPADVVQLKSRHAIILCGINNTWQLDHPLSLPDKAQVEQIRNRIVDDIGEMVNLSLENGIVPIVCSLLPVRNRASRTESIRNELVIAVNEELQNLAAKKQAIYVDYHSRMTDADGKTLREELADDGLHPHLLGYNIMASVLRETLKKHQVEI